MTDADVSVPATFFDRARREAERYGEDPWIFLRELVQNARDAGASTIRFSASRSETTETVVCDDDGCGMSRSDVSKYLLRLYASRKSEDTPDDERAEGAVGRFGVGFWSILRFGPAVIRVDSCNQAGAPLGLEVDCVRQTIREVPTARKRPGTRVTLIRPARDLPAGRSFVGIVGERLRRYTGAVRGLNGGPPPSLLLEGEPLNRELRSRGFIAEPIRGKGFEGVIGLAERPGVRLYAHGLLVKEVASLEELLPRRGQRGLASAPGLYPAAEINADGLEVLLDRQAVVEDRLLETIVTSCDRRLGRLRRRLLDRLAPLPLAQRLLFALREPRRAAAAAAVVAVLLVSATVGAVLSRVGGDTRVTPLAATTIAPRATVTGVRRVEDALLPGSGPIINTPEGPTEAATPWDIRYVGYGRPFIKLVTQGSYDERRGLVADRLHLVGAYEGEPPPEEQAVGYTLFVGVSGGRSRMILPVPVGHRVVEDSVTVDGEPLRTLGSTPHDEPVALAIPEGSERLRYQTVPAPARRPPPPIDAPPDWDFPDSTLDELDRIDLLDRTEAKVARASRYVQRKLRYTTARSDAARFVRSDDEPWIDRVLAYGAGDCDVMNGLNVLTLRALGIPARLGVGFVGERGRVAPDLHAWTEVYVDDHWEMIDISPPRYVPRVVDRPAARAGAGPSRSDFDDDGARSDGRRSTAEGPATPTVDQGEPAASLLDPITPVSPASRKVAWSLVGALASLALALAAALAWLLLRERKRRQAASGDDDRVALALLEHLLGEGGGSDPLHVRHRPLFRTLRHGRISLARVEQLARRGHLLAAHRDNPLLGELDRRLPILDIDDPRVQRVAPRLPDLIRLDELGDLVHGRAQHDAIDDLQRRLQDFDIDLRVHAHVEDDRIREIALPTRRTARVAPRHLFIGLRDPAIRAALAQWSDDRALARFRLAARVLAQSTLYLEVRERVLAALAQEALAQEAL